MYLFKTLPLVCTYPSFFIVFILFFFLITIPRCMLLFFQSHTLYKVTNIPTPDSCLIILLTFDSLNMSISLTIKKPVTFVLEIHPWFYFYNQGIKFFYGKRLIHRMRSFKLEKVNHEFWIIFKFIVYICSFQWKSEDNV